MAGGVGSRFWPLSRTKTPKQFLDILGTGQTFIQQTFNRFTKICPPENIFVVTNEIYSEEVARQLPAMKREHILAEPLRRNTAPCIAYANLKIQQLNPNANIIVAPSDHLILNEPKFVSVIQKGVEFVDQNDSLLTLGITPSRPETGYGYIQTNTNSSPAGFPEIDEVKTFTEKPDYEIAVKFVESGEFFWNSGIFLWSLKSINKAFSSHLPEIAELFSTNEEFANPEAEIEFINNAYAQCRNISIDNGIMEPAENVFVYCTEFGWSDLGTWDSLYDNMQKDENNNATSSTDILLYDTKNTLVKVPEGKLVVLEGLEDFIVAESDNILLVCKRNNERKIREFVNDVKINKGDDFV